MGRVLVDNDVMLNIIHLSLIKNTGYRKADMFPSKVVMSDFTRVRDTTRVQKMDLIVVHDF